MTTSHDDRGFVFTITHQPHDPAYSVDFPDISDIITSGDTPVEEFALACEALDLHLESLQKLAIATRLVAASERERGEVSEKLREAIAGGPATPMTPAD
jgi:predicted RNase H-like HicB family nuclease